jgi:hypothetical protein
MGFNQLAGLRRRSWAMSEVAQPCVLRVWDAVGPATCGLLLFAGSGWVWVRCHAA